MQQQPNASINSVPLRKKSGFFTLPILVSVVVIVLAAIAGGAWYLYATSKNVPSTASISGEVQKVVIGYEEWPGFIGVFLARDKGYFAAEGVTVELKKYDDLVTQSKDYTDGKIDGKTNVNFDAVTETYNGFDQKIVAVTDYSDGADGIIASAQIKTFADIKGKRVAYEFGTLEEYLTLYALQKYNLTENDIVPVNLSAEDAAKALVAGEVDAATTYEPFMTDAINQIHGHKIFSSAEAPALIAGMITFNSDFVKNNPKTAQAIVRALFMGVDFWKTHPDEAYPLIAKELGITTEEAKAALAADMVLDARDNLGVFTFSPGLQSVYTNIRKIGGFVSQKQKKPALDTDSMVDPAFIRALNSAQ